MKKVNWDFEKTALLYEVREIDFERIALMIEEKEFLDILKVPSRQNQMMFVVDYDNYIVCVPFVETEDEIFLKTAYRSRKINKTRQER